MGKNDYDKNYFTTYLERGRFLKNVRGDRGAMYGYWMRYLKRSFHRTSKVLEVGCGVGFFGRRLQKYFSYEGLDISSIALSYAREINDIQTVVESGAESLPFEQQHFDIVIAFDVVEHLKNPMNFFMEAYRVLKLSGIVIISTPNIYSFGVRHKSRSKSLVPSMYKDTSHITLLAPMVWKDMIKNAGFIIVKSGTDTLWDIPYSERIPLLIQKIILIPLNLMTIALFGCLKWNQGENLIIIARK